MTIRKTKHGLTVQLDEPLYAHHVTVPAGRLIRSVGTVSGTQGIVGFIYNPSGFKDSWGYFTISRAALPAPIVVALYGRDPIHALDGVA